MTSHIDQLLARLELLAHGHREIRSTVIALRKALQQEAGKQ